MHPRWQKKRLEIFERDGWECQRCFSNDSTLAVHHKKYNPNTDPWDYDSSLLVTLCEDCHTVFHKEFQTRYLFDERYLPYRVYKVTPVDLFILESQILHILHHYEDGIHLIFDAIKTAQLGGEKNG